MKLRFRGNSLRLRVNRREVDQLAHGKLLEERVLFPGSELRYTLEAQTAGAPHASFVEGTIRVSVPAAEMARWAAGEEIGLYYGIPAGDDALRVMIEKDLECVDGPPEERDPDAFARSGLKSC